LWSVSPFVFVPDPMVETDHTVRTVNKPNGRNRPHRKNSNKPNGRNRPHRKNSNKPNGRNRDHTVRTVINTMVETETTS
jgi:hypothetical protein